MRRLIVKICGITEERDALESVMLGADALGFNFWPGEPRYIPPEAARRIVERLPAFVAKVGVFVDEDPARIGMVARQVGLTIVQLHGDEPPEDCASLAPLAWYKALRVGPSFRPDTLGRYACTTYLLDGWRPDWPGGAGKRFDWRRARQLSLYGRILIAGGLDSGNVEAAIEQAEPYGVDVASGVEFAPGKKDLEKVEAFLRAARTAERRLAEIDEARETP